MLTHMNSPDNVVVREAARAVILDPDQRILLIHFVDERRSASWWATPGGDLRAGESRETAALREVVEETGRTDLPLGPCIWTRRDEFESAGRFINQTEWFFLLQGLAFDVRADGLEALEKSFIREYRWWSLDEIRRSTEEFAPRDLADRLDDLLTQGPPASPVEVGR
jgi:8-oxo-dGTP pyrophosphatase MutT (NUDIX family)